MAVAYCAMPNAIPTTQWLVVPVDCDDNPIRDGDSWVVVGWHDTIEHAESHAQHLTQLLYLVRR